MNNTTNLKKQFHDYCKQMGYKYKTVGDDSWNKTQSPQSHFIKLISIRDNKILIYDSITKTRYFINE